VLSIVLPNGSLERATLEMLDAAGLTVRRPSRRNYRAFIDDPRIACVRFLRPQEIGTYVERGMFDLGITGRDWITETDSQVVSLGELCYSKATSDPVRVVLAVPEHAPWQTLDDLPEGVRISTEFPALTYRFLDDHGVKAEVVESYGATEAKIPDIADAIVDLTETGSSLRENGLRILSTLLTSYTELVANRESFENAEKHRAMEEVAALLQSASRARDQVLLKLRVTCSRLQAVNRTLPEDACVTEMPCGQRDVYAVEAVVPKRSVNVLIPELKAAGADHIMEVPLAKIVD
jgi:ATP phosphoribosyltransferase